MGIWLKVVYFVSLEKEMGIFGKTNYFILDLIHFPSLQATH